MLTDSFRHEAGEFLARQTEGLLRRQASVAAEHYVRRTGRLSDALNNSSTARVLDGGAGVELEYPLHIRFLDLKRNRSGRKKRRYAPIYNRYVYGYIRSAVWRWLNARLPHTMASMINDTIKEA